MSPSRCRSLGRLLLQAAGCALTLSLPLSLPASAATTRAWTNSVGGSWFTPSNWSPNGVPVDGDTLLITNNGTYTVSIPTNTATVGKVVLGGASGIQSLVQGSVNKMTVTNVLEVRANGVMNITNAGFIGHLHVQPQGKLNLNGANGGLQLYSASITNLGTVTWTGGSLAVGGSNSDTTSISNGGSWIISGDINLGYGGGSRPVFFNTGTIQKSSGTGSAALNGIDVLNLGAGLIDVTTGTLRLSPFQTNVLGGTLNIAANATVTIFGGTTTDAGLNTTGTGSFQLNGGTAFLRTNLLPGLKLLQGDVLVHPTTFQQGGAITNLTLDGSALRGTNRVAGQLVYNAGSLGDRITVLPGGTLTMATSGSKLLYGTALINQGTFDWTGGTPGVGGSPGTVISNGALWRISSDDALSYGGGSPAWITNVGTIRKVAGNGTSGLGGAGLVSLPGALVQADTGTIGFLTGSTNTVGEFRANGGRLGANNGVTFAGSALVDGSGSLGAVAFAGGTLSPGVSGSGQLNFNQGLNLAGSTVFSVDATGTVAGSQYDQLVVTGPVSLGNATLKITSLPSVPVGTAFVLIDNDGNDPVTGTFNNLPEDALVTLGAQIFRIHYAGGTGNDVVLVRDTGIVAPSLTGSGLGKTGFTFGGTGGSLMSYTVQATTNFVQWTNIATVVSDPSGHISFTDTNASKFRYRFYRTSH